MSHWISTAIPFWRASIAHLLMLFFQKIANFKQTAFSGDKEVKNRIEDLLTSMFIRFTTKCLEIFLIVIRLFFIGEIDIPELQFSDYFVFVIKWEIMVYFLQ